MSNIASPYGLRPVRHLSGAPWNGALIECYVSSSYAVALFKGDPVLWSPTLAEKDPSGKRPTINTHAGTDGLLINGVIDSFAPLPNNLTLQYNPASTERIAYVALAQDDLIFQVQDDGTGAPTKVFPSQNAELAAGAGGSTLTGLSSFVLDASTPTTTQTFPLNILALSNLEDNELDDYADWDVLINTNERTAGRILGITAA